MGGKKFDGNKPRMELLDYAHLVGMAETLTFGAGKYGDHNWRAGIHTSRLFGAIQRHLAAFWEGEDLDPESGLSHLLHASVDLMMLHATVTERPELDNRYKKLQE